MSDTKTCPIIETRYYGPTETRGSCVRAWNVNDRSNRVRVPWNHRLEPAENHLLAAAEWLESNGVEYAITHRSGIENGGWLFVATELLAI